MVPAWVGIGIVYMPFFLSIIQQYTTLLRIRGKNSFKTNRALFYIISWLKHHLITRNSGNMNMQLSILCCLFLSSFLVSFLPSNFYLFWMLHLMIFWCLSVHCDRRCTCWCSSCNSCENEVQIGYLPFYSIFPFPICPYHSSFHGLPYIMMCITPSVHLYWAYWVWV